MKSNLNIFSSLVPGKQQGPAGQRGSIIVHTALLLPLLFMFVGLGYDVSYLYMEKGKLQNVVDASALAGTAALRQEHGGDTLSRLITAIPTGENTSADDSDKETADTAATQYFLKNLNLEQTSSSNNFDSEIVVQKSGETKKLVYYTVTGKQVVPLSFMRIIGQDTANVSAQAIAVYEKPVNQSTKDWYHMYRWELAQISNEERLAYDQQALIGMAKLFIGKTAEQAINIFMPNASNNTKKSLVNHIKKSKEIIYLNYTDKGNDDSVIQTTINDRDTRSPQAINWSRGDFGTYDETSQTISLDSYNTEYSHYEDMRFFFSDWMLETRDNVDRNRRSFRLSFTFDSTGTITAARCRINRDKEYLYELDVTVTSDGYEGQTEPGKTGTYKGNQF